MTRTAPVQEGAGGIIVSNHGARNLDTVPATLDALPHVADTVSGRIPVLVDGGIRRGTDVVKALARGANAVLIGRPYLYGLANLFFPVPTLRAPRPSPVLASAGIFPLRSSAGSSMPAWFSRG